MGGLELKYDRGTQVCAPLPVLTPTELLMNNTSSKELAAAALACLQHRKTSCCLPGSLSVTASSPCLFLQC